MFCPYRDWEIILLKSGKNSLINSIKLVLGILKLQLQWFSKTSQFTRKLSSTIINALLQKIVTLEALRKYYSRFCRSHYQLLCRKKCSSFRTSLWVKLKGIEQSLVYWEWGYWKRYTKERRASFWRAYLRSSLHSSQYFDNGLVWSLASLSPWQRHAPEKGRPKGWTFDLFDILWAARNASDGPSLGTPKVHSVLHNSSSRSQVAYDHQPTRAAAATTKPFQNTTSISASSTLYPMQIREMHSGWKFIQKGPISLPIILSDESLMDWSSCAVKFLS